MHTTIDTAQLFTDAHAFARKLILMRFNQYREAFAFALREKWSKAKAAIKAAAQRSNKQQCAYAWELEGVKVAEKAMAIAFEVSFNDGSKEVVWFPRRAVREANKAIVAGWFFERVKEPELIVAFPGKEVMARHYVAGSGFTVRDGIMHIGKPARHYSIYNDSVPGRGVTVGCQD